MFHQQIVKKSLPNSVTFYAALQIILKLSDLKQQPSSSVLWFCTEIQPGLSRVVLSCQMVFTHVSLTGLVAGLSGRLGSVGSVHHSDYMWPFRHGGSRVVELN